MLNDDFVTSSIAGDMAMSMSATSFFILIL
jgi:hypothetical protein